MTSETWKPVIGYEDCYEISHIGRIRSSRNRTNSRKGKILSIKQPRRNSDYCRVELCRNNIKHGHGVHVLVAEAFHGKRPRGKFPNHKDLDKTNNRADNLEWLTRRQNQIHAIKNGRKSHGLFGETNGRSKLTINQVNIIRKLKGVISQRDLADLSRVSRSTIQFIHQGKHWPADLRVREFPTV